MRHLHRLVAGAIAGAVWFPLPFLFDIGVRDMQDMQPIPVGHTFACIAAAGCAALTGAIIACLFRRCLVRRGVWFFLVPIVTVPFGIVMFSLLLWIVRQSFGIHSQHTGTEELLDILAIYGIYALMSIFAPIVYAFALLTQYVFRVVFARAV
jgi:hypothetical protein